MAIPEYIGSGLPLDDSAEHFTEGLRKGEERGYSNGYAQGRSEGWSAAIAEGNQQMLKQMEYTRQHLADKEALARRVEELTASLAERTQRNTALDAKLSEHGELVSSFNRAAIVVNAMRETLVFALAHHAETAQILGDRFRQAYGDAVDEAMREGSVQQAPHKDDAFQSCMPRASAFVHTMLNGMVPADAPSADQDGVDGSLMR